MKHTRRNNAGFTLVELVVAIAVATVVTAAATTVLLLAMRVNRQSADTASQQYTVRALLTAMENAAAEGNIKKLTAEFDSWALYSEVVTTDETQETEQAVPIFNFVSKDQTIYTNGTAILKNVYASNATLSNGLLTISIETADGTYTSSIFCRMALNASGDAAGDRPILPDVDTDLESFVEVLLSQYGSRGKINYSEDDPKTEDDFDYFSEWYIQERYTNGIGPNGWNADTPWCACYVSWALTEAGMVDPTGRINQQDRNIRWFAEVDDFVKFFKKENYGEHGQAWSDEPTIGSLVFFDWIGDDAEDAQHMGVVLSMIDSDGDGENDTICTIEGNSAGRVSVCSYPIGDWRILGYGVLTWKEDAVTN